MKGKFKILTLILVCVVCFGCFACASNKEDTKKETKKKVETVEDKEEKIEDKEDAKEEAKEEAKVEKAEDKAEKKEAKTLAKAKGNKQNNTTASKPSASKPSDSASKPNNSASKPATSKPSGSTSKPSGSTSKPSGSTSKPSQPSKPAHTHSWVEQTKTVTTEEQGHYVNKTEHHSFICNGCGKDFGNNGSALDEHQNYQMMHGNTACGGWHDADVVVGKEWVVDVPASSKVVVTGYKCSGCGATK